MELQVTFSPHDKGGIYYSPKEIPARILTLHCFTLLARIENPCLSRIFLTCFEPADVQIRVIICLHPSICLRTDCKNRLSLTTSDRKKWQFQTFSELIEEPQSLHILTV